MRIGCAAKIEEEDMDGSYGDRGSELSSEVKRPIDEPVLHSNVGVPYHPPKLAVHTKNLVRIESVEVSDRNSILNAVDWSGRIRQPQLAN